MVSPIVAKTHAIVETANLLTLRKICVTSQLRGEVVGLLGCVESVQF